MNAKLYLQKQGHTHRDRALQRVTTWEKVQKKLWHSSDRGKVPWG
jgi:hypothetical protein